MVCSRGCGANDAIDSITIQPFVYYLYSSVKRQGSLHCCEYQFCPTYCTVVYTLASSVINIIVFSFGAGAANSTLLDVYGQSMTGAMTGGVSFSIVLLRTTRRLIDCHIGVVVATSIPRRLWRLKFHLCCANH